MTIMIMVKFIEFLLYAVNFAKHCESKRSRVQSMPSSSLCSSWEDPLSLSDGCFV